MAAALASVADRTPEGQSIVTAVLRTGVPEAEIAAPRGSQFIEFSAQTRIAASIYPMDGKSARARRRR